jgi:hypothetical protein
MNWENACLTLMCPSSTIRMNKKGVLGTSCHLESVTEYYSEEKENVVTGISRL